MGCMQLAIFKCSQSHDSFNVAGLESLACRNLFNWISHIGLGPPTAVELPSPWGQEGQKLPSPPSLTLFSLGLLKVSMFLLSNYT